MASQPPLVLADNVFDHIVQYPDAVVSASSAAVGREARRVANYRRERDWWEPASDGGGADNWLEVDLGDGHTHACNALWIDRGHNLWGRTVQLRAGSTTNPGTVTQTYTVPAEGTVGGDPTSTTFAVTEEGALWVIVQPVLFATPYRFWRLRFPYVATFIPRVPNVILGAHHQLAVFSAVLDEDAGGRRIVELESDAGYLARGRVYDWRTLELDLSLIGDTEYDGTIRALRRLLFQLDVPYVAAVNYGDWPARAWMYRLEGRAWSAPMRATYRSVKLKGREHEPRILSVSASSDATPAALLLDTFSDPDNAASMGTAETGQTWVAQAGVWGLTGGRAYTSTPAAEGSVVADIGAADHDGELELADDGSGGQPFYVFRATDANNLHRVGHASGLALYQKRVASSYTTLASQAHTLTDSDVFGAEPRGTSVTPRVNGTTIGGAAVTESFNSAATKVGIGNASTTNASAMRFARIEVQP